MDDNYFKAWGNILARNPYLTKPGVLNILIWPTGKMGKKKANYEKKQAKYKKKANLKINFFQKTFLKKRIFFETRCFAYFAKFLGIRKNIHP